MAGFSKGDPVKIIWNDEGYLGQFGVVFAVFPTGRCQVAVGRIAILHLTPEMIIHVDYQRLTVAEASSVSVAAHQVARSGRSQDEEESVEEEVSEISPEVRITVPRHVGLVQ